MRLHVQILRVGFLTAVCTAVVAFIFAIGNQRHRLQLTTTPVGAVAYLDSTRVGSTPQDVDIPYGRHRLLIDFSPESANTNLPPLTPVRHLKAAYIPLTANLPLFVAIENGYFAQNGIEVEAVEASSPNDIMTSIVSGDTDFAAVVAYTLIFPAVNRFPDTFKLYSSSEETASSFTSSIITLKESPIQTYQDLRGKRIGVYTGIVQESFLKAMLNGMNIDPSEVSIVSISPRLQIQGLVANEYDALSTTEPTSNIAVIQGIAKVVSPNPRSAFIMRPFPSSAAVISAKLVKNDPQAAEAVARALNMAIDQIRVNPELAKPALLKYTPIPKQIAAAVLADLKLFKYCKLGEENRLNVQRFADLMFEIGLLEQRVSDVNPLFADFEN